MMIDRPLPEYAHAPQTPAKSTPRLPSRQPEGIASYERGGMWLGVGLITAAGVIYVLGLVVGVVTLTPVMIALFADSVCWG